MKTMMIILSKIAAFLRTVWSVPGIKQIVRKVAVSALKQSVKDSTNKVDDKIVAVVEAALANKNYRAILNGKAKK
jgi:hypothetical protein